MIQSVQITSTKPQNLQAIMREREISIPPTILSRASKHFELARRKHSAFIAWAVNFDAAHT